MAKGGIKKNRKPSITINLPHYRKIRIEPYVLSKLGTNFFAVSDVIREKGPVVLTEDDEYILNHTLLRILNMDVKLQRKQMRNAKYVRHHP